MKRIEIVTAAAVAAMVIASAGPAGAAAPKAPTTRTIGFDSRISSADGSVLAHDGNPDYIGRKATSTVDDQPSGGSREDAFLFLPWEAGRGRTTSFQHPSVEAGRLIRCNPGRVEFSSGRAPSSWWEELAQTGSTLGQARIGCYLDGGARYVVRFPRAAESGSEECVSFARTGERSYSISAEAYVPEHTTDPEPEPSPSGGPTGIGPVDDLLGDDSGQEPSDPQVVPASGCPATITFERWQQASWVTEQTFADVSAPFVLELTLR